jgi:predicted metal-dependent hydrolase
LKSSIECDGENIPFEVRYVDRKTLEIAVHPDGGVLVKAPLGTTPEAARVRVRRRARWIKRKLDYFRQFEPRTPPRRYVGGETHLFLGRQYRLKLVKSGESAVKLKGAYFFVMTPDPTDAEKVKVLLDDWYSIHARLLFHKRLLACYESAQGLRVPLPGIMIRWMAKRWGSCSKLGRITLNVSLIKAPLSCIDYVIVHELCHLKIPYHNNKYWRLLGKYMPDWEERKKRLEDAVH